MAAFSAVSLAIKSPSDNLLVVVIVAGDVMAVVRFVCVYSARGSLGPLPVTHLLTIPSPSAFCSRLGLGLIAVASDKIASQLPALCFCF
jgi:hypothetical protein